MHTCPSAPQGHQGWARGKRVCKQELKPLCSAAPSVSPRGSWARRGVRGEQPMAAERTAPHQPWQAPRPRLLPPAHSWSLSASSSPSPRALPSAVPLPLLLGANVFAINPAAGWAFNLHRLPSCTASSSLLSPFATLQLEPACTSPSRPSSSAPSCPRTQALATPAPAPRLLQDRFLSLPLQQRWKLH